MGLTCRVCNLPIGEGEAAFDPAVDWHRWQDDGTPWLIHKRCVPRACKELVEEMQREQPRDRG